MQEDDPIEYSYECALCMKSFNAIYLCGRSGLCKDCFFYTDPWRYSVIMQSEADLKSRLINEDFKRHEKIMRLSMQ